MADVNIKVSIVSRQAEQGLDRITARAKFAEREIKDLNISLKDTASTFKIFAGNVAANAFTALARGAVTFGRAVIDTTVEFEKLQTQLITLIGDTGKANELFNEIKDFAATTPFQLTDISQAANQLIAFGVESENVTSRLQEIGDVAAASGTNIRDLTQIFGQVSAAGKLTGERLLQLQERAIPIGPAIAKTLGIAESQVREFVSGGLVDFETFQRAFQSLSTEGGFAFNGLAKQSQTLGGQISNLEDNFDLLIGAIGERLAPVLKESVSLLNNVIQSVTNLISEDEKFTEVTLGQADAEAKLRQQLQDNVEQLKKLEAAQGVVVEGRRNASGATRAEIVELRALIDLQKQNLANLQRQREEQERAAQRQFSRAQATRSGTENPEVAQERAAAEKRLNLLRSFNEERAKIQAEDAEVQKAVNAERLNEESNELENLFRNRAATRAQARIDGLAKELSAEERNAREIEIIRQESLSAEKQIAAEKKKIKDTELKDQRTFFTLSASLANSQNKTLAAIGKASAITQIAIKTPEAVASSFAFGARIGGPPLGFVFGGIAAAAMAAQAAQVAGLAFQDGGIVPGTSFSGDRVAAQVNSGEVILNRQQQAQTLFAIANGANMSTEQSRPIEVILQNNIELDGESIFNSVSRQVADGRQLGEVV